MITAIDARTMARKANEGINKARFYALKEKIELDIMSTADAGNRCTRFARLEFDDVTGIEFVIDELRDNGFCVTVKYDNYGGFVSMLVGW